MGMRFSDYTDFKVLFEVFILILIGFEDWES